MLLIELRDGFALIWRGKGRGSAGPSWAKLKGLEKFLEPIVFDRTRLLLVDEGDSGESGELGVRGNSARVGEIALAGVSTKETSSAWTADGLCWLLDVYVGCSG